MTKYKKNGKKLGVLGGMGPAAAAEFLRQLAAKCPAAGSKTIIPRHFVCCKT